MEHMNSGSKDFMHEIIHDGTITSVPGVLTSSCHCGIRKWKEDLSIIFIPGRTVCSGVFTKNKFAASPVTVTRQQLEKNRNINAIVINSGIANACTGEQGLENARKTIDLAAKYLKISPDNIVVSSTGRIGKQLPLEKIEKGISYCSNNLSPEHGHRTARAILTIDKHPKEFAVKLIAGEKTAITGGIAKGSVMVEPDMATTLSFVTTNIKISPELLDRVLYECVDRTFNCITTDGCQSTNDMVLVVANGNSGMDIDSPGSVLYGYFRDMLLDCLGNLSRKVVEDGEGATKVVQLNISGALNKIQARNIGKKVANSILFKAAMYGEDVNWGRIASAIGSTGEELDSSKIDISIGDVFLMKNGMAVDFDRENAEKLIRDRYVDFNINLKAGNSGAKILTNDISYEYIKI
ncbi:MAG: bifunctional glutamate N-acetyltransferase/amino-acid acetyltransferase ArgJ, partial [Actinobacteria bacterium]|nr:bifunctional glutamate N-acetyltransferase/amino-acid acetyltransferase ArgJ [Actinomycetota bacterium]